MNALTAIFESGDVAEILIRIATGAALLVGGLVFAWILGRLATRSLRAVGIDDLAERFGVHEVLARLGFQRSLARLVGRAVRIALSVVVVIAALAALGLRALSRSLNEAVLFLPKLLVALALVLIGAVVADFARDRISRLGDQMDLGAAAGRAAQIVVFGVFALTAIAQLGIPTQILTALVALVAVAAALTLALAFGLGGRDVARQLSAGRYVGGAYRLGETISLDDVRGEIVALESAATVVRTEEGELVRVPNQRLLESIVRVHGSSTESSAPPPA